MPNYFGLYGSFFFFFFYQWSDVEKGFPDIHERDTEEGDESLLLD